MPKVNSLSFALAVTRNDAVLCCALAEAEGILDLETLRKSLVTAVQMAGRRRKPFRPRLPANDASDALSALSATILSTVPEETGSTSGSAASPTNGGPQQPSLLPATLKVALPHSQRSSLDASRRADKARDVSASRVAADFIAARDSFTAATIRSDGMLPSPAASTPAGMHDSRALGGSVAMRMAFRRPRRHCQERPVQYTNQSGVGQCFALSFCVECSESGESAALTVLLHYSCQMHTLILQSGCETKSGT